MSREIEHFTYAVASLEAPSREFWQPDRDEQMAALEILLASSIPTELRRQLRDTLTLIAAIAGVETREVVS